MYASIFGLSTSPFSATDRPETVMPVAHSVLLKRLVFALQGGRGVVELVVEGRTPTLPVAQYLVDQMPDNCRCTCVVNPRLSQLGFLHAVCQQLAVPLPSKEYAAPTLVNLIWDSLSDSKASGETNVLIVNEADHAPIHVLKQIAELTDHAPDGEDLLQVVLVGHSELHNLLKVQENQEIARSVSRQLTLPALAVGDTARYIQLRMENGGWRGPLPFEPQALAHIHAVSEGMPEAIDLICDQTLQKAQSLKKKQVTLAIVQKALAAQTTKANTPASQTPKIQPLPTLKLAGLPSATWPKMPVQVNFSVLRAVPKWAWIGVAACAVLALLVAGIASLQASESPPDPSQALLLEKPDGKPMNIKLEPEPEPEPATVVPSPPVVPTEIAAPEAMEAKPVEAVATDPTPAPAEAEASTSAPDLAQLKDGPDDTWPAIGKAWGLQLGGTTACDDALKQGHQCFRSLTMDFAGLLDLNRPGLVRISDKGETRWVQLVGTNASGITLASGKQRWKLSVKDFQKVWKGAFSTLWRLPPDANNRLYAASINDTAGQWIDEQLKNLQAKGLLETTQEDPQARLEAFQKQQGLPGDGKALPSTFIRVNQLTGVSEPKLRP